VPQTGCRRQSRYRSSGACARRQNQCPARRNQFCHPEGKAAEAKVTIAAAFASILAAAPTDKHFVWELTDARPDGGGRHDLLAILMISLARCRRPADHYAALHSMSPMLADPGLESSRLVPSGSDYDPTETSPSLVSIETEQLQI
jgi:hypothetical protein